MGESRRARRRGVRVAGWRGVFGAVLVALAAALAGCQRTGPVEPFSQDTYFSGGGGRWHFVSAGKGRAVVLLHDSGSWSYSWRQTLPALSERYKVLAVDLPGCGLSGKPAAGDRTFELATLTDNLSALLRSQGVGAPVVVGHGWGGNIALALAARHPRVVRGLVVSGAWAAAEEVKAPLLLRVSRMPVLGWLACKWPPTWLIRRHFAPLFGEQARVMTAQWLEQVMVPTRDEGWCNVFAVPGLYAPLTGESGHALGDIEARTLLLWGEKDELAPVAAGRALEERLANVRLQIFSGAGHMLPEERPAEFNQAVLTFIESLSTADLGAEARRRRRALAGPALPKPEVVADIDRRCPCPAGEASGGRGERARYRRCVRDVTTDLRTSGAITGAEQAAMIRRSARSTCGRPHFVRCCRRSRCRVTTVKRCERLAGQNLGFGSCYPDPCREKGAG